MTVMETGFLEHQRTTLPGNIPTSLLRVDRRQWLQTSDVLRESGALFLTLWGADDRDRDGCFRIYAAYLQANHLLILEHAMREAAEIEYPGIAHLFPAAQRMQRAVYDLLGISTDERDTRGWLRHGGWPETQFPLRRDFDGHLQFPNISEPYSFILVEGDGVHEIAVGPVHAGTIEPGHFRFSVVGEKVLRLEERFGYKHKGIAKRFEELPQQEGQYLAGRVSGDSTVAFSWAYCAALEAMTKTVCPARGIELRALALEHERIANHLGDLGALGNDAGFAFGLTQFSRLKEDLLRANKLAFGARYLIDFLVPGGMSVDLSPEAIDPLLSLYITLGNIVSDLQSIYSEHSGVQDRFREAGKLDFDTAQKLGAVGLVGRASGIPRDLRVDHSWPPYHRLAPKLITQTTGDVAARVQLRFEEIFEALRICRTILEEISPGPVKAAVPIAEPNLFGIGAVEGWRGPVMIALESGPQGTIRRCHAHDPSWQNWPLLEYAIIGNIVPDFPLINKSFNLSYSGQDG